jgi:hypothetical protein
MVVKDLDSGSTGKFYYDDVGPSRCIIMKLSLIMLLCLLAQKKCFCVFETLEASF